MRPGWDKDPDEFTDMQVAKDASFEDESEGIVAGGGKYGV